MKSDLGADLCPCENCEKITILSFSLCYDCRKIIPNPMMTREDHANWYKKELENEKNQTK